MLFPASGLPRSASCRRPAAVDVPALAQQRQQPVPAQLVVVVEVLVAQADAQHALLHQPLHRMLDPFRPAMILEAPGQPPQDVRAPLHLPQHDPAGVARDLAAVENAHHVAPPQAVKFQFRCRTLRRHKAVRLPALTV